LKDTNLGNLVCMMNFISYDEFHKWQEVSWPWFIMASITGLGDYLASYRRYYSEDSPIGGIGYINARL